MALLPVLIFVLYVVIYLFTCLRKWVLIIYSIVFSILLGLALALPVILDLLPAWMIPTRFSDFSFWSNMINQLGEDLKEHIRLAPRLRDEAYMILFYKQTGLTFFTVILTLILCFRNSRKLPLNSMLNELYDPKSAQTV